MFLATALPAWGPGGSAVLPTRLVLPAARRTAPFAALVAPPPHAAHPSPSVFVGPPAATGPYDPAGIKEKAAQQTAMLAARTKSTVDSAAHKGVTATRISKLAGHDAGGQPAHAPINAISRQPPLHALKRAKRGLLLRIARW